MKRLGMDIGTSTIKVAVLEDQVIKYPEALWKDPSSIKRNAGRGMCPKGADGNVRDRKQCTGSPWSRG